LDVRGSVEQGRRELAARWFELLTEGERDARGLERVHDVVDRWRDAGSVYAVLDVQRGVEQRLAEHYDWIIYTDDFPENATTWRYLRGPALVGRC